MSLLWLGRDYATPAIRNRVQWRREIRRQRGVLLTAGAMLACYVLGLITGLH